MEITDTDRINFLEKHSSQAIGSINFDDRMEGCKCGCCKGVGIYEFPDDDKPIAFGEDLREAIDNAMKVLS